ncbi:MAG: efflux RND transporter periplasmic adaptor subunit [Heliobacteriaceae bacterium]|nr:efflux RND transporter periplasmic adaptor subunit [Heliobacteriaceae bacterium]MDD4588629.1 efflux RND transporter periplasmic adaptor subunit [Heliobacteriaceae bacterium]
MKPKKRLIFALVGIYVLLAGGISAYYWYQDECFVVANDARVKLDFALVRSPATGCLETLPVYGQQAVKAGEVLAVVVAGERLPVVAPVTGKVLRLAVTAGEQVIQGQPLLAVGDPATAYVEARIPENRAVRVQAGQPVTLELAAVPGRTFTGMVAGAGRYTEAVVWPVTAVVPARQQPKETALVPVKIAVEAAPLAPGTGAAVKIRVKGAGR